MHLHKARSVQHISTSTHRPVLRRTKCDDMFVVPRSSSYESTERMIHDPTGQSRKFSFVVYLMRVRLASNSLTILSSCLILLAWR